MNNIKNINSAAEIRASDAAVISFINGLIQVSKDVIAEHGDIGVSHTQLIESLIELKNHRISKSKGEG